MEIDNRYQPWHADDSEKHTSFFLNDFEAVLLDAYKFNRG